MASGILSGAGLYEESATMTVDKPEFELRWPSTLRWLRQRYEWVEEQLSSTRPAPGNGTLKDSTAHERWVTDNVGLFAEESLLLREIAARTVDVAAGAHRRSDVVPAVAGIFPALREEEPTLPASLVEKLAIYYESYAEPGQPVADVLRAGMAPGTTRYRELASIANDLGVVLDATADAEEVLYARTSLGVDPDAPDLEGGPSHGYQEYVVHGVFAPYGRRTQGPVSSLDDHYIGPFGDDWGSGWEPAYDIGPSGTDEEHYAELGQYRIWLTARALRTLEAGGQKAIPHGTAKVDLDRLLTVDVARGCWIGMTRQSAPPLRSRTVTLQPTCSTPPTPRLCSRLPATSCGSWGWTGPRPPRLCARLWRAATQNHGCRETLARC